MKKQRNLVILVLFSIILSACSPSIPTVSPEIPTNIPTTLTGNDLKNGTYVIEGQPITLVDGIAETDLVGSASKQVTRYFGNEVTLDLNQDGLLDSVFLLTQDNGGSGTFYYVVAALQTENGYVGTNAIFIGDRIAPQSTNIDPNNKAQVIVNYADRNAGEPMSAVPTIGISKTFKLEDGVLVEVLAVP